MQGLARGDDVVENEDALAAHLLGIRRVEDEGLLPGGGNGLDLDLQHAGHVSLGLLAREKILVCTALARHFVKQRNGLRLRRDEVVILRRALQQLRGAVDRELDVPEDDEGADEQIVADRAERQLAL